MFYSKGAARKGGAIALTSLAVAGIVAHAPYCPQGQRLVCQTVNNEQPHGPHDRAPVGPYTTIATTVVSTAAGDTGSLNAVWPPVTPT
jgi:hypothetical protein